jgi:TRAP transporter 4TM/12TM fusion protein
MSNQPQLTREDVRSMLGEDRDDDNSALLKAEVFPGEQRKPIGLPGLVVTVLTATICAFTLWMAFNVTFGPIATRGLHLMFIVPLAFLLYPAVARATGLTSQQPTWTDWALAILSAAAFAWAVYSDERLTFRRAYVDPIEWPDIIMGTIAIVAVLEVSRRTVGMSVVYITLFFIGYALFGSYFPGMFNHAGTEYKDLIETLYMMPDGVFNFITGTMATFVFTFLAFGAFLRVSGGDRVFTTIALALAGHRRGGPAKVAVVSSALMGMLSGSTVSNVVTTGAFTIPLMKRTGYKPYEAAAIESVASLGGAIMPPVMGAGVFIMASFTGVPLIEILAYSVAPAILYYVSLYAYVDIKARKKNLLGLPRELLPKVWPAVRDGGHIFLPVGFLIYLMFLDYAPFFASAATVVGVWVISWARKRSRMTPSKTIIALEAATRGTINVSALGACAAIMYGVIAVTGLLGKITSMVLAFSGGSLVLAIILIGFISYVMGMGLPVTAAYVLLAALGSPALQSMGVSVLAAHLIIYWFSQDSTITPPVCMTAFVAARLAGAPPMKTGWQSVLMAKALYIIPFVFAFGSLLDNDIVEIVFDSVTLFFLFALMPIAVEGFLTRKLNLVVRAITAAVAIGFYTASVGPMSEGYLWFLASGIGAVAVIGYELRQSRRAGAAA